MSNKWMFIWGCMVLCTFFACKKKEVIPDREEILIKDTTKMVFRCTYLSHTDNDLNVQVEMLQLNGLESEVSYSTNQFLTTPYHTNIDYFFSGITTNAYASNDQYSTVLLFNLGQREWYTENFVGVYLRRFFEQIESDPNRKAAFSSFEAANNTNTRFHSETKGKIFNNSWQYSTNTFYELTASENQFLAPTQWLFFKNRMVEIIDSLVLSEEAVGDLSVTVFTASDLYYEGTPAEFDEIVVKCASNNVRLNVIGTEVSSQLRRLAYETGGFVCEYQKEFFSEAVQYELMDISSTQVGLENLNTLLSGKVTTHRANLKATQTGTEIWSSGSTAYLPINYGGTVAYLELRIP